MTAKREFYTTNEIAQILGLSPFTVRRYIQARKLKAVKLEGSYRVRQSHLDQFIAAREIETAEELAALENAPALSAPPRKIVRPIEKKRAARPTARKAKRPALPRARPAVRRKEKK